VPEEHVAAVAALLAGQAVLEPSALATASGLGEDEVRAALSVLGASGRTGFDLATGAFFHRDLPYDRALLSDLQPRLKDAWALVGSGAVTGDDADCGFSVRSGDEVYRVVLGDDDRCSCPWFRKHRGERGPCKHVLAAGLVASGDSEGVGRS
jgi:hypothetical protein